MQHENRFHHLQQPARFVSVNKQIANDTFSVLQDKPSHFTVVLTMLRNDNILINDNILEPLDGTCVAKSFQSEHGPTGDLCTLLLTSRCRIPTQTASVLFQVILSEKILHIPTVSFNSAKGEYFQSRARCTMLLNSPQKILQSLPSSIHPHSIGMVFNFLDKITSKHFQTFTVDK